MNSGNRKTFDSHRLLLNHSDKINSKIRDKYVALWNLYIYYTLKYIKKVTKKTPINLKYHVNVK